MNPNIFLKMTYKKRVLIGSEFSFYQKESDQFEIGELKGGWLQSKKTIKVPLQSVSYFLLNRHFIASKQHKAFQNCNEKL